MKNLVVPVLAIFLVSIGVAFADIEVTDDLKEAMQDDSSAIQGSNYGAMYSNSPATQLFIELDTRDEYHEQNDVFLFEVLVTNVGKKPARDTRIRLEDLPATWNVWPESKEKRILRIAPNETKHVIFAVERDENSAPVFATAKARNSRMATSNVIHVPVFLTTLGLLALAMVGASLYVRR